MTTVPTPPASPTCPHCSRPMQPHGPRSWFCPCHPGGMWRNIHPLQPFTPVGKLPGKLEPK